MMDNDVDLVINVFERTLRSTLAPGTISAIVNSNRHDFRRKIILINNVNDRAEASVLGKTLVDTGEIDNFYFVGDMLETALSELGLSHDEINPFPHYTDWALVSVVLPDSSPFLCHWDAEVQLAEPADWISPSIEIMKNDSRVAVANPNWRKGGLEEATIFEVGPFAIGYGFSDQLYLIRVEEFRKAIYQFYAFASLRGPLSHITTIFEQRVDSYMRCNRRLRATYRMATYYHPDNEGHFYPKQTWKQSIKRFCFRILLRLTSILPIDNPEWKV